MAQEQYWRLVEQGIDWQKSRGSLRKRLTPRSHSPTGEAPSATRPIVILSYFARLVKRITWLVRWRLFFRQHRGESFRCFRPEWLEDMLSEKIVGWTL